MVRYLAPLCLGLLLVLSACGRNTGDRAASGAGLGAGAGAVVGAVTGLSVLEGVLIGAAAGGLLGGLTDDEVINLGDPIWATDEHEANDAAVARVQAGLQRLGYDPGSVDGVKGAQTDSAIRAYQRNHGLLVDGRATLELAQHIEREIQMASN